MVQVSFAAQQGQLQDSADASSLSAHSRRLLRYLLPETLSHRGFVPVQPTEWAFETRVPLSRIEPSLRELESRGLCSRTFAGRLVALTDEGNRLALRA